MCDTDVATSPLHPLSPFCHWTNKAPSCLRVIVYFLPSTKEARSQLFEWLLCSVVVFLHLTIRSHLSYLDSLPRTLVLLPLLRSSAVYVSLTTSSEAHMYKSVPASVHVLTGWVKTFS